MKKYSSKRSIQILAHLLKQYGISDIVVSPGSRNAPLAIHFGKTDGLNTYSIVDERSAAFVAAGMSLQSRKPSAITCTSGSAAANYYPAITEAFYSNIPLLVLTADRPTDYIDIFDGQTIRQKNLFQQHSYGDFELLEDSKPEAEDYNFGIIKTAIELCIQKQGPVHINIPLEEPLYELVSELPMFPEIEKNPLQKKFELSSTLTAEWNTAKRILILVGTRLPSPELEAQLAQLVKNHSAVVLCEVNSNLHNEKFFPHIDRYIFNFEEEDFKTYAPDLLITIGQNVVSKKIKQFLRKAAPKVHWHIDEHWQPDTYHHLSQKIEVRPEVFFAKLLNVAKLEPQAYYNLWDVLRDKADAKHDSYTQSVGFSDYYLFYRLSKKIPANYSVHFSNSSAIRYAQLFEYQCKGIYCNRGTSGIDGSTSTAIGFAMKNTEPTLLVTGDISFFYDVNGLWNQYIPPFTRIIIFNNGEGNIFRIIPGPSNANENILEELITTKHSHNAENIAKHFGFSYVQVDDDATLNRVLENFFSPGTKPKILEVMTQESQNAEILKDYFRSLGGKNAQVGADN